MNLADTIEPAVWDLVKADADGIADILRSGSIDVQLNRSFLKRVPNQPIPLACKAGCAHCCRQRVLVTPLEVLQIAAHLRRSLPVKRQKALRRDLAQHLGRGHATCPLLTGSHCSVYPVRPLKCAAEHSLDAEACAGVHPEHPMLFDVLMFGDLLITAIVLACHKLGLEPGPLDLSHGVLVALQTRDASVRWLKGEPVFKEAYRKSEEKSSTVRPMVPDDLKRFRLPVLGTA